MKLKQHESDPLAAAGDSWPVDWLLALLILLPHGIVVIGQEPAFVNLLLHHNPSQFSRRLFGSA